MDNENIMGQIEVARRAARIGGILDTLEALEVPRELHVMILQHVGISHRRTVPSLLGQYFIHQHMRWMDDKED